MGLVMATDPRPAGIKGWLTANEAVVLQRLAKDRIVLEIGAYHGLSTIVMAKVAKRVYSIDPHTGAARVGPENTLPVFLANLEAHGVRDKVVPLVGETETFVRIFKDAPLFCMAFIDGSHTERDVETDTASCVHFWCKGGIVAWHDWNESQVRVGARSGWYVGKPMPDPQTVDGLAWIE